MNNKLFQSIRTRLVVMVLMSLCAGPKVCAQDYLAGWTLAEGSLPADVSKYYFAIVDVTSNSIMGLGESNGYTTMTYRSMSDPKTDFSKAWTLESMEDVNFTYSNNNYSYAGQNCYTLRNLQESTYVLQTGQGDYEDKTGNSTDYRAWGHTTKNALSAAKFEYQADQHYWLIANGFHNIARSKSYYLGGWDGVADDHNVYMSCRAGEGNQGKYRIYYTERTNFVSAGTDVSRLISNGDFEAGSFVFKGDSYEWAKGWQGCGTGASWGGKFVKNDTDKGYFSGNWTEMWGWTPENTLQQSLVGVPNGIYKLEAEILAYDEQEPSREHIAKFYANGGAGEVKEYLCQNKPAAVHSLTVEVTNGRLDLGLKVYESTTIQHNVWVAVDNFRLTYLRGEQSNWNDVDAGNFELENSVAKAFLSEADYTQQGAVCVSRNYMNGITDTPNPVSIQLPVGLTGTSTLYVSTSADYSNAETHVIGAGSLAYDLYNLVPGRTYYYKVENNSNVVTNGNFTTSGTLRMIKTEGGSNIRDLGGRITMDGKKVRYGRLFRGGELRDGNHTTITDADIATLKALGIKAELDLRSTNDTQGNAPTSSCLEGDYKFIDLVDSGKELCTEADNRTRIKQAISFVAESMRNDKPVYFHCIWGADRTGALAFFLENILGFTLDDMYKDFELTSFSKAGHRAANWNGGFFLEDKVGYCQDNYVGNSIQEQVVNFLKDGCGVTDDEINAIRNYMLEDDAEALAARYEAQKAYYQRIITLASASWNTASADATHSLSGLKDAYNQAMNAVDHMVDMTSLLTNADLEMNNDGWVYSGWMNHGGLDSNHCIEVFMSNSSIRQSLSDLPAGNYILKVQGYERTGDPVPAYEAYCNGTAQVTSYIKLNDTTQPMHNILDDAQNSQIRNGDYNPILGVYVPNSHNGASQYFSHDNRSLYWNVARTNMDQVGTVCLTIAQTSTEAGAWSAFDNVKLYYCGNSFTEPTFSLNDGSNINLPNEDTYYKLAGNRTLKANCWNTLCVPFDMTSEMLTEAGISDVRTLSAIEIDGTHAKVNFAEKNEIKAGRPYIVRVNADYPLANLGSVLVRAKHETKVMVENGNMTGYYNPLMDATDLYFISGNDEVGNKFVYAETPAKLRGLRAYITIPVSNNVKSFYLDDDATDAILELNDECTTPSFYNLQGVKVDKGYKGIVISEGKKIYKK